MNKNIVLGSIFGVVVIGGIFFVLARPGDRNVLLDTNTLPNMDTLSKITPEFQGVPSCPVLIAAIAEIFPTQSVSELSERTLQPIFQGGRYWNSSCQYDDPIDPATFSSNIDIKTFATENEAKAQLTSDSNNRSSTSGSTTGESSFAPGAFIITTNQYGVKTQQLTYVYKNYRIQLVVGGEASETTKLEALARAINQKL